MRPLYERLAETEYGETLLSAHRWGRFKPEWMPVEDWEHILGPDVNNYKHMGYMAGLTENYLERAEAHKFDFVDEEPGFLIATAYVHDFAEAIDGDVPDPEKVHTVEAYEQERNSFIKVLSSVTSDPETISDIVLPIMQGRSMLSAHWRAIELIGYTETTIKAKEQVKNLDQIQKDLGYNFTQTLELYQKLMTMSTQGHGMNIASLRKFEWIPMVKEYLEKCTD
jgi:5'-deoxynucleotidase YfbR-like HD superfamily hydrolase